MPASSSPRWAAETTFVTPAYAASSSTPPIGGMGLEAVINPKSSVDIVGTYEPLATGFDYAKLGIKPKPVSDYR